MLAGSGPLQATEQGRLSEALLPKTTQGFAAIYNVDTLTEHWNKTELGHLMADPVMKPFSEDLRRQFDDRWSSIRDRLGLTIDDIKGIAGGDVGLGMIAPKPGQAAMAIVVDVTGKLKQAQELLQKTVARQVQHGASRSEVEAGDNTILQLDLPVSAESREASPSTLKGSPSPEGQDAPPTRGPQTELARQVFYCLSGALFVVADNLAVMRGILARAAGKQSDSLAGDQAYQVVSRRCRRDAPPGMPQLRWFVHPLGYAEVARIITPPENRRKGKSILEVMRNQGLSGIQGVGGRLDFAAEGFELVHRTAIYAPEPREKALKMLDLLNEKDFAPQAWVPRDVASFSTLYANILQAFDNFGPLYDELFGAGEKGVWQDTLFGLKEDPNGPQLDLRGELMAHLGRRITVLTDYHLPITTTSERLLFAIETTDAKAVQAAMEKWMGTGPDVKRHVKDGQIIWEMIEQENPQLEAPEISFGNMPAVAPPTKKKKKAEDEEEPKKPDLLPHMAVTVWQGKLMIASHIDFLLKVIRPPKTAERLADDVDYKLISEQLRRLPPKERSAQVFSRSDEAWRPTYELIRQNKMPESESLLGRLLNAVFAQGQKGAARRQKIDGSKLPDYQVVRRYLGPAGFKATTEGEGWFLKGFMLSKNAEDGGVKVQGTQGTKAKRTKAKAAKATKPAAPAAKANGKAVPTPRASVEIKGSEDARPTSKAAKPADKPAAGGQTDSKSRQGSELEIKTPDQNPPRESPRADDSDAA